MDIVYSHVKEPIRKGKLLPEVFKDFSVLIEKACPTQEEKDAAYDKLRGAISLAWDEVKPVALMNRQLAAKEAAKDKSSTSSSGCTD
jgi:hypothetical protein